MVARPPSVQTPPDTPPTLTPPSGANHVTPRTTDRPMADLFPRPWGEGSSVTVSAPSCETHARVPTPRNPPRYPVTSPSSFMSQAKANAWLPTSCGRLWGPSHRYPRRPDSGLMALARILSWLSRSMRDRWYPSGSGSGPLVPPSCQYQRRRSLRGNWVQPTTRSLLLTRNATPRAPGGTGRRNCWPSRQTAGRAEPGVGKSLTYPTATPWSLSDRTTANGRWPPTSRRVAVPSSHNQDEAPNQSESTYRRHCAATTPASFTSTATLTTRSSRVSRPPMPRSITSPSPQSTAFEYLMNAPSLVGAREVPTAQPW